MHYAGKFKCFSHPLLCACVSVFTIYVILQQKNGVRSCARTASVSCNLLVHKNR